MQAGKVFQKLAGHKNVASIDFSRADDALITLKDGLNVNGDSTLICKTAHEARLWIQSATRGAGAPVETPKVTKPAPVAPAPKVATPDKDGTITLDSDWVRERTEALGDENVLALTGTHAKVRVTTQTAALLVLAGVMQGA